MLLPIMQGSIKRETGRSRESIIGKIQGASHVGQTINNYVSVYNKTMIERLL